MAIPPITVCRELWNAVATEKETSAPALPESTLPLFLAGLPVPQSGRPVLVVLLERSSATLPTCHRAMTFWKKVGFTDDPVSELPSTILPTLLPQERSGDIPTPRLRAYWQALTAIKDGTPRLILSTQRELEQPAPRLTTDLGSLIVKEGQPLSPTLLAERLLNFGYTEERAAEEPGTFARRGGILDVFPFHLDAALRIEFASNIIASIRSMAPRSSNGANTEKLLARISETKAREWPMYPLGLPSSLPLSFGRILHNAYLIAEEGALPSKVEAHITLEPFSSTPTRMTEPKAYGGNMKMFSADVNKALASNQKVMILTARPEALKAELDSPEHLTIVPAETAADARGFASAEDHLTILTDADIGETVEEEALTWDTGMAYARMFTSEGLVVHRDHGIARFRGIERKELSGSARDYLVLEYAQGDKLFVPVEMAYKVTAYIGAANPVIHRLGGSDWESITREVRKETAELAGELIQLYASREIKSGTAYPPDTEADRKLEDSFPYEETHDQKAAIREVKRDMERAQPMDRLVCGDVGFGKTEVAIRAAFKAVNFGRQVVVLSPTTLLAQQHYDTFRERLKNTGARLALMSRFQTAEEQNEIIEKLSRGDVDIVIGTHRLLSDDMKFKALGLLIIDEEQKFGVEQKERMRKIRASVDVLSLSATPIPRTLHMSLSGLRSLSVIATPPGGRRPVITKVGRENDELIKKALLQELERGGQAYVLWNRVESIEAAAERIRKLVPKARIVVGHGQMVEQQLMQVMEKFDMKEADILVCSTIIQNGIDLPNVNTLIVFDAPSFGLSDLYQLRGRVGRGNTQAYAHFLYRQGRLPFEARKRLAALLEAAELGSGWTLALRDLEIRGAGNLLGKEQHGTIRSVGVHLFGELLAEEVERLRSGEREQPLADVQIDLPVKAFVPETYIPNTQERLAAYTRTGSVRTLKDLSAARQDLEQHYGPLPENAETFFHILRIKLLASRARVAGIVVNTMPSSVKRDSTVKEQRLTMTLQDGLTPTLAYAAIADNPRWTFTGSTMTIPAPDIHGELLDGIEHTLRVLGEARESERLTGKRKK